MAISLELLSCSFYINQLTIRRGTIRTN